MKKIYQQYLHTDSQHGDCWRACLASILECDIDKFPYHNGDISWPDEYDEAMGILDSLGYEYATIPVNYITENMINSPDTDGYVIAIGKSIRGVNHSVVWKNGMAHDPHPDNTGLAEITRFEILIKK